MEESTFETFAEELATPQHDVSPAKPLRQSRRPEMYSQRVRRVKEESPIVQQVPKSVALEPPLLRRMSLHKTSSMQNMAPIEPPWEGVTLNRCLVIAITILVLASGCQRLHEFLRGRKVGPNVEVIEATLITKDDLLPPRIEPSVWETFFNWLSEDDYDDDDDDEQSTQDKSIKLAGGKAKRGLRHKTIPDRKLLKKREAQHKARRVKKRWDQDKTETKAQREMVKTTKGKKRERNRADNSKSEYKGKFTESWSKRKEKK